MRQPIASAVLLAAIAVLLALPAAAARPAKSDFKTTHVTLYDCGLAQLEKQTDVSGAQRLGIAVTLAHLDDLLASLVVATDGNVRVTGVNYPSVRNLGQAIEASGMANALSADGGSLSLPADVPGYLEALVGMSVAIDRRDGGAARGTVLACVDDRRAEAPAVAPAPDGSARPAVPPDRVLVLVSPGGAIRWIPADEIAAITPISTREAAAVSDFATQLGKSNGFAETEVVLETAKGSQGRLAASYIRQIPLWRTAYKVTAGDGGVAMEAWAVVHNDTTESWKDVEMTLISGLPKSYVLSVASPRYRQRETLVPEGEGDLMPQLGSRTADSILYDFLRPAMGEAFGYGGMSAVGMGAGGGSAYGRAGSAVSYSAAAEGSSSLIQVGAPAAQEQAEAAVEGEISTYRALNAVTIPARTSSLVPLIRREMTGGAFTLLEYGAAPSTCVRVKNETGLVLQDGVASFYIGGRFRGQAEIPRTEPDDVGIWCFGEDPDVTFSRTEEVAQTHEALEWRSGALWSHNLKRTTLDYAVDNRAGQARSIALDIRHIANGRIVTPEVVVDADLDSRKLHLFEVPARGAIDKRVVIEEGVMTPVGLGRDELVEMSRQTTLPAKQREALAKVVELMDRQAELATSIAALEKAKAKADAEAEQQRENLRAVPEMRGRSRMVEKLLGELVDAQGRAAQRGDAIEKARARTQELADASAELLAGLHPAAR
jgi:hypothetical protein